MPAIYEDSLQAAKALLGVDQLGGFSRRRAVSSAYYALFQRLCWHVAVHLSKENIASEAFRRSFRILEHGNSRKQLKQSDEFKLSLGAPFEQLQDIRQWADYSARPNPDASLVLIFPHDEAQRYVNMAEQAIDYVNQLDISEQARLTVCLLARDRQ